MGTHSTDPEARQPTGQCDRQLEGCGIFTMATVRGRVAHAFNAPRTCSGAPGFLVFSHFAIADTLDLDLVDRRYISDDHGRVTLSDTRSPPPSPLLVLADVWVQSSRPTQSASGSRVLLWHHDGHRRYRREKKKSVPFCGLARHDLP
jgi:hypothetical protein